MPSLKSFVFNGFNFDRFKEEQSLHYDKLFRLIFRCNAPQGIPICFCAEHCGSFPADIQRQNELLPCEWLGRALHAAPERPDLYLGAVALLVKRGQAPEALRIIQEGARTLPENREILLREATTLEFAHSASDAEHLLSEVQTRWPEWSGVWLAHGIILATHRHYEEARQVLEMAVTLGANALIRRSVGTSDRLRKDLEVKLRRFLHALVGGRDGKGWEFGRPVLKAEMIHLVEEVPGVEGVDAIDIRDEQRNVGVEHLRLDDDELPFLVHVHIAEKVRDDIR